MVSFRNRAAFLTLEAVVGSLGHKVGLIFSLKVRVAYTVQSWILFEKEVDFRPFYLGCFLCLEELERLLAASHVVLDLH